MITQTSPARRCRTPLARGASRIALLAALLVLQAGGPARAQTALAVGAGDRIAVSVFGQAEMAGEYLIADDGRILMPLVGSIAVAGLTLPEVQKQIAAQLADGYLREPVVGVRIAEFRPIYVVGDVRTPGSYPFRFGTTVLGGVALAGGYGRTETPGTDRRVDFLLADERTRSLETRLAALLVKAARLDAQRDGARGFDPPLPSGVDEGEAKRLKTQEIHAFETDTKALGEEVETLGRQRPRLEADIKAVQEQLDAEKTQLSLIREHIAGFSQLIAAGYARRYTGIELQREEARNRGNVARLNSELARLDIGILEVELRMQAARSNYRRRVLGEIDLVRGQIAELRVTLPAARELRAARLQQAGTAATRGAGELRRLVVVRGRGGETQRLPADETMALQPGDVVEVTVQSEPLDRAEARPRVRASALATP